VGLPIPTFFDILGGMRMYKIGKLVPSKEEKVAIKLANIMTDFTLDVEAVGKYLATATPHLLYARLIEVLESAQYQHQTNVEYDKKMGMYRNAN
jgi:hypothetical protein